MLPPEGGKERILHYWNQVRAGVVDVSGSNSSAHPGVARSAANIDDAWIGLDVHRFLTERLGRTVQVLNDADAAGVAIDVGFRRRYTKRANPARFPRAAIHTGISA